MAPQGGSSITPTPSPPLRRTVETGPSYPATTMPGSILRANNREYDDMAEEAGYPRASCQAKKKKTASMTTIRTPTKTMSQVTPRSRTASPGLAGLT